MKPTCYSIINIIDIVDFLIAILTLLLIISSVVYYDVNLNLLIYKDPLHIGIGRNRGKTDALQITTHLFDFNL